MSLNPGTRLGPYEITAQIGVGGMGEVYRARDTKLGRGVAVKILPDAVATDPDRVARFEREAKVLASLNHPHIAALFGMEESSGRHFLVMELVEGETLADRLARGAIPVQEGLRIASQVAEALEAAHESGIVHRDLKPANIKITPDDKVKVLDFGLAKALETAPAAANLTHSPTLSVMASQAGLILGTAAYMSPEQARGFPADVRSDVFSFGVVLYEMLTGRQPFQGETAPDVMASVLVRDPDLSALPATINPRLRDLLRRCLEKNPKKRWQAVGDLRVELETIAVRPLGASTITNVVVERPSRTRLAFAAAALSAIVALGTAVGVMVLVKPQPEPRTIARFPIALAEGQQFSTVGFQSVAISPDGSKIAYVANNRLFVRSLSDLEARPLTGPEFGGVVRAPVFSPDGLSIAFQQVGDEGTIKKIGVNGGVAITICPAGLPYGMSWGDHGITFGQSNGAILEVSGNGGKPEVLVPARDGEVAANPQALPDGEFVLFSLATTTGPDRWDRAQIVAQSVRSGERKVLIEGGSDARYVPTGHLVYAVGGSLFAVRFDVRRLEVIGAPIPIVEGVRRGGNAAGNPPTTHFSISGTGSLVYIPGPLSGSSASHRDLGFVDRSGQVVPLKLPPGSYEAPRVSPDGKHVAFGSDDGKEASIWVYELAGATSMRKLTLAGVNRYPAWAADSQRVAFQSDREGDRGIFWQRADGTGAAERLTKPDEGTSHVPESWSPNGETLLFAVVTKDSRVSLRTLSLRDKKTEAFGNTESAEYMDAVFSPDGRWVAYDSTEGTAQSSRVYVEPFPRTGARYLITKDQGRGPLWSPDGKELFYAPSSTQLEAVQVRAEAGFAFGNPTAVPRGPLSAPGSPAARRSYDLSSDKRFLGTTDGGQVQPGATERPVIQVVLNWQEELKARVPTK